MHQAFGLRLTFCFELAPTEYHTNVVMVLLAGRIAMLAVDGFRDPAVAPAIARACGDRAIWPRRNTAPGATPAVRSAAWSCMKSRRPAAACVAASERFIEPSRRAS